MLATYSFNPRCLTSYMSLAVDFVLRISLLYRSYTNHTATCFDIIIILSLKLTFSPLKIGHPNRKLVFQPSIFRGYVSLQEGKSFFYLHCQNMSRLCLSRRRHLQSNSPRWWAFRWDWCCPGSHCHHPLS